MDFHHAEITQNIPGIHDIDSLGFLRCCQCAVHSNCSCKNAVATPDNAVMLTIFLKHDQSRPLAELKAQLAKQGFYKAFPPAGVEIVSWNIMMGIGQVVTVRFPASRLAEVNLALENTAWGVTEPSSIQPMTSRR